MRRWSPERDRKNRKLFQINLARFAARQEREHPRFFANFSARNGPTKPYIPQNQTPSFILVLLPASGTLPCPGRSTRIVDDRQIL